MRIPTTIPTPCPLPSLAGESWWARWAAALEQSRGRRVCCLLIGLWIVNAFDLFMTVVAYRHHLLDESNPIAAWILPLGPGMLMIYKIALVTVGVIGLYVYRRKFIAEFASWTLLLIYVFVAIRWKNCFDVYEATCANLIDFTDQHLPPGWGLF